MRSKLCVVRTAARIALFLGVFCLSLSLAIGQEQPGNKAATQQQAKPAESDHLRAVKAEAEELERMLGKGRDDAAILYMLAVDYLTLGDKQRSLSCLEKSVAYGEGFSPEDEQARLEKEFGEAPIKALAAKVQAQFPAAHNAVTAFTLPEKDLIPEGMAADPDTGDFLVGSLNRRKIVSISQAGKITDFISEGENDALPVLGIKVDSDDGSVWANTATAEGRSELLHLSKTGGLLGKYGVADPRKHFFNDLVVTSRGEIFVTDTFSGQLLSLKPGADSMAAVELSEKLRYPNGIALSSDEKRLYVADALGVTRVDLPAMQATTLRVAPGITLAGVDGLYCYKNSLIAVQNAIGSKRVVRFLLDRAGSKVTEAIVLENRTPAVELPTTGALLGDAFYFISNSQLDNYRGGKIIDPSRLRPVTISKIALRP